MHSTVQPQVQRTDHLADEMLIDMNKTVSDILTSKSWSLFSWEEMHQESGEYRPTVIDHITYQFADDGTYTVKTRRYTIHGNWEIENRQLNMTQKDTDQTDSYQIESIEQEKIVLLLNPNTDESSRVTLIHE